MGLAIPETQVTWWAARRPRDYLSDAPGGIRKAREASFTDEELVVIMESLRGHERMKMEGSARKPLWPG